MVTKKKYKHIFFDLDNTLWDFEANSAVALKLTFDHFQLHNRVKSFPDFHEVYLGHNERLWDEYRKNGITKQELVSKRFQHTFDEFGITGINPLNFNEVFLDIMPTLKLLLPGAPELLDYLQKKYYSLYIITNGFKEVQEKKLEMTGIRGYFKKVFISEDIKAQKPSPVIFEYALKSSNARKLESIMVGDSWEVDIEGAMNFGMDQVFLSNSTSNANEKTAGSLITTNSNTYTFIIHQLSGLFSIF